MTKAGAEITCLNCGGTGIVTTFGLNGMKYPRECRGCQGTGKQIVRPA